MISMASGAKLLTGFRQLFAKNPSFTACSCSNKRFTETLNTRKSSSCQFIRKSHSIYNFPQGERPHLTSTWQPPYPLLGNPRPRLRHSRHYSTGDPTTPDASLADPLLTPDPSVNPDPYTLVEEELSVLCEEIKKEICTLSPHLQSLAHYHFDGKGKAFRPMIVMLMARACNIHQGQEQHLARPQQKVSMIAEMIHTASLVHDDVIDEADTRRGKPSVQGAWGQRQAILTGDVIMAAASMALARIRHVEVVKILSQVLEDLVSGEFMQLGSKEDETERFNHYLKKTYRKTASLLANSCKAVAVLAECSEADVETCYQYGRNVGIAFQLVDDLLDFVSSEALMGKPTAADLKLGLATAPVLFAAHQHPELNAMIMRRFTNPGDVQKARELVNKSDGVSHTHYLARQHCNEAVSQISSLSPSPERDALVYITHKVLNRLK